MPAEIRGRTVRLVKSEKPLARAAAANVALKAAKGELVNFLDDDDELLPHHLTTLCASLENNPPSAKLAYSLTEVVDDNEKFVGIFGEPHVRLELFEWSKFTLMAALFRRDLLEKGVCFDETLPIHEDHDFWLQCAQHTHFRFVDKVTSRWHAFIGTSGAGGGPNMDNESLMRVSAQVKGKWLAVKEEFERSPDGLLQRAQLALKKGTPEAALAFAEKALLALPDDINAINLAAMANHYTGNSARAKVLINMAVVILPGHAELLKNKRIIEQSPARLSQP